MLWEEHPDVMGKLDDLFWEDQKVWYKCIDEKNEGIILEQASEGEIQVRINIINSPNESFSTSMETKRRQV